MDFTFLETLFDEFLQLSVMIASTELGACAAGAAIITASLYLFNLIVAKRSIL